MPVEQASNRTSGLLAGLSLLTGLGAAVSASCCVLPVALGSMGAGAATFAILETLADYRLPLLVFGAVTVACAWSVYWRRRGARSTAVALALASVLVVAAASWDRFEPSLLRIMRTR